MAKKTQAKSPKIKIDCAYDKLVQVGRLKPNPENPNTHTEADVKLLAAIIKATKWRYPITVSKQSGMIVDGHRRYEAGKLIGDIEVPVDYQSFDSFIDEKAEMLRKYQLEESSVLDGQKVADFLVDADQLNYDLSLVAMTQEEIEDYIDGPTGENPEDDIVPDPPKKAKTKTGDLITLGKHRLLCGDCTVSANVGRLMGKDKAFLCVTDPPYGVEYDADWRNRAGVSNTTRVGKVSNDDRASWAAVFSRFQCNVAYVWHAGKNTADVERSLVLSGYEIRSQIIWVKKRFALSRGHYHWRHEPCFYAVLKGESAHWRGGRKKDTIWADIVDVYPETHGLYVSQIDAETLYVFEGDRSTVWEIANDIGTVGNHSTQKPVECMARPIKNNSQKGDIVADPFLGSGSTLIACEKLNRRCFGMEIDPIYCDVIVERWEKFTGKKAKRP